MRIKAVNLGLLFIFFLLFLGLLNLQVIKGDNFRELSNKNSIRLIPQPGMRGRILDRKGNVIVGNRLSYNVLISPENPIKADTTPDIDKILMRVSKILDTDIENLKIRLKDEYVLPFAPIIIAQNLDINKAIILEELKRDLPGLIIQPYPERSYPYGRLASHVIGYLGQIDRWRLTKLKDFGYKTKDIVGFGGVEEKYDYYLRQQDGGMQVKVDHLGRFVRVLGFRSPKNGRDIQLTLDLKIQRIIEKGLLDRIGSVIVMEPYSGEILAMASNPNFSPSVFTKKWDSYILDIFDNPQAPLVNRSISSVYPAGSVFKLVVATSALETRKINLSTSFFCPGSIHIGNQEFSCWNKHEQQNLMDAIIHSCNIFFYRTGLLLGGQLIHDFALKFGFSEPTSVDLPYETGGFVPSPLWKRIYKFKNWFDGDTANLAIGQAELLVSPLQITRMMAVFANQGLLVTPYIVKAIDGYDIADSQRKIMRVPLKEHTIEYIRQALRKVVADRGGTANILSALDVSVAGKTGTAQVSRGQPHGWFVGFLPFKNPKFVICVFLEHAGSGQASCVLAKQIIEEMIKEGLI